MEREAVPSFRYDTSGNWYKGNLHIHSTASDGGKTFTELAQMYAGVGYDFLVRTDHWVASNAAADEDLYPLLWLDGIELNGEDSSGARYHVVCLGTFTGVTDSIEFNAALEAARAQGGLLILAHPFWTGNTLADALRWGFHGVEVYNHVCRVINGKGDGTVHWNKMLEHFPNTLAFAVDDAHVIPKHPGWDGGWIVANAQDRSRQSILDAVWAGNFYATRGPAFHTIECDHGKVSVRTSPVRFVRLVGPAHLGRHTGAFDGPLLEEASLDIPRDWPYVYLEIEDGQGRCAWTNPLFVADS